MIPVALFSGLIVFMTAVTRAHTRIGPLLVSFLPAETFFLRPRIRRDAVRPQLLPPGLLLITSRSRRKSLTTAARRSGNATGITSRAPQDNFPKALARAERSRRMASHTAVCCRTPSGSDSGAATPQQRVSRTVCGDTQSPLCCAAAGRRVVPRRRMPPHLRRGQHIPGV